MQYQLPPSVSANIENLASDTPLEDTKGHKAENFSQFHKIQESVFCGRI